VWVARLHGASGRRALAWWVGWWCVSSWCSLRARCAGLRQESCGAGFLLSASRSLGSERMVLVRVLRRRGGAHGARGVGGACARLWRRLVSLRPLSGWRARRRRDALAWAGNLMSVPAAHAAAPRGFWCRRAGCASPCCSCPRLAWAASCRRRRFVCRLPARCALVRVSVVSGGWACCVRGAVRYPWSVGAFACVMSPAVGAASLR
jgi:hypothetical protein